MKIVKKLLPMTLGGEYDNYWNRFLVCRARRHRDRAFLELISKTRPRNILEIGVAQGWGAELMVKAIKAQDRYHIEYYGFDLFCKCVANKYVSTPKDEIQRRLEKLGVKKVCLFAGDSRKTLPREVPNLPKMELICIDGDHSFEVCKSDWENIQPLMHPRTIVVFDDYDGDGVRKVVDAIKGHRIEVLRGFTPKAIIFAERKVKGAEAAA